LLLAGGNILRKFDKSQVNVESKWATLTLLGWRRTSNSNHHWHFIHLKFKVFRPVIVKFKNI
jgi:hypothetical protein